MATSEQDDHPDFPCFLLSDEEALERMEATMLPMPETLFGAIECGNTVEALRLFRAEELKAQYEGRESFVNSILYGVLLELILKPITNKFGYKINTRIPFDPVKVDVSNLKKFVEAAEIDFDVRQELQRAIEHDVTLGIGFLKKMFGEPPVSALDLFKQYADYAGIELDLASDGMQANLQKDLEDMVFGYLIRLEISDYDLLNTKDFTNEQIAEYVMERYNFVSDFAKGHAIQLDVNKALGAIFDRLAGMRNGGRNTNRAFDILELISKKLR